MAISKVTLNGTTLMDVTQDTVATNNLLTGETATGADGEPVAGSLTIPTFTTQEKTVTPTESEQVVQPDSGKDGLSKVTVGAISKTYVGSNISRRDSTSLSASGATVTVPAGYYATQASKSVSTTTHPKPTVSLNSTTGVVTASHVQSTGYVTGGTTTETLELTTKAAATITPSETQQEIASGQYLTGKQTIAAIPSTYVGSGITVDPTPTASGKTVTIPVGYYSEQTTKDVATVTQATPSVSVNSSGLITATATQSAGYVSAGTKSGTKQLVTKAAATITPGTTDQTIAASTYLTGAQTIKGDANLVSENIAEGKSIFGVAGSFVGGVPLTLEVNVDTGSAVTVTNGTTTLTGTSANNKCTFTLPEAGTWTANATKDGQTSSSETKTYTTSQSVTLSFVPIAYTSAQSGVTYTDGIGGLSASELNEIAMTISNNSGITSTTSEVWVSKYNRHLSTGDTTSISVSNKSYSFRILGFNHDDLTNTTAYGEATATGKAGITFQMVDCLDTKYKMNSSATNSGGWDSCAMRSTHLSAIKNTITSTWTNIMKTVTKKASVGEGYATLLSSNDVLFLFSTIEIFGSARYACSGEGDVYAYWSANNTESARIKKVNGSASDWWARSPQSGNAKAFCHVRFDGAAYVEDASASYGVAFGFCV